jgi:hypothetical protein
MTTSHREFMVLGVAGANGLAYALSHVASPLKLLDLRLNSIGNQGVIDLCSALASSRRPQELILAACGFTEETGIKFGRMLQQNSTLQALDISNNYLGEVYSYLILTVEGDYA